MRAMIFGSESELISAERGGRRSLSLDDRYALMGDLARAIRSRVPCVVDTTTQRGGIYLASGSKLYTETFGHPPEVASPEVASPRLLIVAGRAMEDLLIEALDVVRRGSGRPLELFKTSRDPLSGPEGSTVGSHESYMTLRPSRDLVELLTPFLVSREVLSGGGGIDLSTGRLILSQRAAYIRFPSGYHPSGQRQSRAIVDLREEALAVGGLPYHRLHLTLGSSNRSEISQYIRAAATGAVLVMMEGILDGTFAGREVTVIRCADPVKRFHDLNREMLAPVPVATEGRRRLTAIDVQERYLRVCQAFRAECHEAPPWYDEALATWEDLLRRLHEGPEAVESLLDWAIKGRIFRERLSKEGARWEDVRPGDGDLRHALLELDFVYGLLDGASHVRRLEAVGVMPRLTTDAEVAAAIESPPDECGSRAKVRGAMIRRVCAEEEGGVGYAAGWTFLARRNGSGLGWVFADPFADEAVLAALPGPEVESIHGDLLDPRPPSRPARTIAPQGPESSMEILL